MFIVTVDFEIAEDKVEQFRPIMGRQAENSLTKEPGCLQFDVAVDPKDPCKIFLYEVYVDEAAFQAHLETDHFKDFDARSRPLYRSKVAKTWTRIWPK